MTSNHNLLRLHEAGVAIWLDTLSRELLESGEFARLVREYSVSGATSNPTIFARAIESSSLYDRQLKRLLPASGSDAQELFFALALEDVRNAARELRPTHEASGGSDGFISFECTPDLADDTEGTIAQAVDLWERLGQPNAMIKVPGTLAGLPAIEELTRRGVNVNVTLLFAVDRYVEVIDAYLRGLHARADVGAPLASITSVASFFLSRIDSKVDAALDPDSPLRGRVALASAKLAYQRHLDKFSGAKWERLRALGARPQRPLWASTGTKDPAYSDVHYVEGLIGPGVVNTMPESTLRAFADHGEVVDSLGDHPADAAQLLMNASAAGVDIPAITLALEREGVRSFCDSYRELLACIEHKMDLLSSQSD
ncbi:MAG: transaldolase [Solirubrobacterales bacterium]